MLFCILLLFTGVYQSIAENKTTVDDLAKTVQALGRQLMLQQFYTEQFVRTEGSSGLKIVRARRSGLKNYHTEAHNGYSVAAIHDHSNHERTVGMGEFVGVLNGIQFRTRHNDYKISMPSQSSKAFHKTELIPFPDVPPSVLEKGDDIDGQIKEMREYFLAWRDQNSTHRDYDKYFRSILCYLEGAWTTPSKNIDEPFASDRHFLDAKTWHELQNKVQYFEYNGGKTKGENLALLPTKVVGFMNDSIPKFAQWNYRIMCHPTRKHLPTSRLRVVEDLSSRMMTKYNIWRHVQMRGARFQVNTKDDQEFLEKPLKRNFLDELMEEVPGKDNYGAEIEEEGIDSPVLNLDGTRKNVGYYHRWFKSDGRDAMGTSIHRRGFNDEFLFVAATSQRNIAGRRVKACDKRKKKCKKLFQRVSYAVPLEVIYLTPLSKWNPYNLPYSPKRGVAKKFNRTGSCETGKEFNGTDSTQFYRTPREFFSGTVVGRDPADTVRGEACVRTSEGNVVRVKSSGVRILLPNIDGVGILRQRYPIMPIHGEGSPVWKELNGLRDIVMDPKGKQNMIFNAETELREEQNLTLRPPTNDKFPKHTHQIYLSAEESAYIKAGFELTKTTSVSHGHSHNIKIRWRDSDMQFYAHRCEDKGKWWYQCRDKHGRRLKIKSLY